MAKALLDSLDGLSADLQKEYIQVTEGPNKGKYLLTVESVGGLALEDVAGLKKTVQTLRGEKEALTQTVKKFEGIDPEAAINALNKVKEWGDMTPEQKAQELLKSKEAQLAAKFKQQEDALKGERDEALKQLDQNIRVAAISQLVAAKKPMQGGLEFLLPHAMSATRMKRLENGTFAVEVIGEDGQPRISPSGSSTDLMTLPQLVEELATKFPFAFEANGSSGSGATGGGSGSGKPTGGGGGVKTVSRSDQDGMNRNLEAIAKGTVKVV